MVPELDPVRPVHPTWPSRRVPEEGDEPKRQRPPPDAREDHEQSDEQGGRDDPEGQSGRRHDPPGTDGIGHHVDEYV